MLKKTSLFIVKLDMCFFLIVIKIEFEIISSFFNDYLLFLLGSYLLLKRNISTILAFKTTIVNG